MPAEPHSPPGRDVGTGGRPWSPRLVALAVVAETLLAAALDVWHLGRNSVWVDEAYTWSTASRPWSSFVHLVVHKEGGGLLHSLVMFGWLRVGDGAAWLRVPSVLFAVAGVPLLYLVVRRLAGTRVALVAGLLFALNGNVVHYAQEARTYSLTALLAIASFLFFVRVVDEGGERRPSTVAWVVSSALLVYTFPLAASVVVAQLVSLVFLPRRAVPSRAIRHGSVAIVVLWLPMAVLQVMQSAAGRVDGYLEGGRTPAAVVKVVLGLSGGGGPLLILGYAVLVLVALGAAHRSWSARHASLETWRAAVPFLWLAVPCVVVVGASYVVPNFAGRYLLMAVPGLATIAAVGVTRVLRARWTASVLVVVVALASLGIVHYYGSRKDDFRDATAFVLGHAHPGDEVAFVGDEGRIAFEYFTRHGEARRAGLVPAYPTAPWGGFGTGDEHVAVPTAAQAAAIAHSPARVWVFRYGVDGSTGERIEDVARGRVERRWQFAGGLALYLLTRPDGPVSGPGT